jgi:hypothetical protein
MVGFVAFPSVCGICVLVSICTILSLPTTVICSLRLNIALPQAFALQELNFVLLGNFVNQEVR